MEIILVVVIFRLMMQKSYKPDSKKGLTEKVTCKDSHNGKEPSSLPCVWEAIRALNAALLKIYKSMSSKLPLPVNGLKEGNSAIANGT